MDLKFWEELALRDADVAKEMAAMSAEELHDAFYRNLEFGTAGMRGILGMGPNRINLYTVGKASRGFGKYLLNQSSSASVVIAHDNRYMSKELTLSTAGILSAMGIEVYVFESLRPTAELSFAVRELGCTGGIVITASHNPKEYNGYKVYDETGCQLVDDKILELVKFINEEPNETLVNVHVKHQEMIHTIGEEMDLQYHQAVLDLRLRPDLKKAIKIVFTSQHGTAYPHVPDVLRKAGYEVIVVEEQKSYDPAFSNTLTPNPEDHQSFDLAISYAKKYDADLVLSCDPDADRMRIVVKHLGEYQFLTGNQGGSILLDYILSSRQELGIVTNHPVMYNTIVTSDLGEKMAHRYHVDVIKTLTGFKYIGQQIELNKNQEFVFGYEESYGYLLGSFVRDKDAVQACLMVAEAANFYALQGLTLVDVLVDIFTRFGYHREEQLALTFEGQSGMEKIQSLLNSFRVYEGASFGQMVIKSRDDFLKTTPLNLPASNVLKFYFDDSSWMAVRPSGTEPKCKIYFCIVGDSQQSVDMKYEQLLKDVQDFIA